jgi:HEPN domain-containing protein
MSVSDEALAREWFEKAEHDLLNVRNNLAAADIPTDTVCFHCHQAAEKYLKGFLVWHAVAPDRTHDLENLLQSCARIDPTLNSLRSLANSLNPYAIDVRYPDTPYPDPTLIETRSAFDAAREIRAGVRRSLGLPVN